MTSAAAHELPLLRRHCACGNTWDEAEGECPACGADDYETAVLTLPCPQCGTPKPRLRYVEGQMAHWTCRACFHRYDQALTDAK